MGGRRQRRIHRMPVRRPIPALASVHEEGRIACQSHGGRIAPRASRAYAVVGACAARGAIRGVMLLVVSSVWSGNWATGSGSSRTSHAPRSSSRRRSSAKATASPTSPTTGAGGSGKTRLAAHLVVRVAPCGAGQPGGGVAGISCSSTRSVGPRMNTSHIMSGCC
jgi:hypothetical protein